MVVSNLVVSLDLKIRELAFAEDIVLEYPEDLSLRIFLRMVQRLLKAIRSRKQCLRLLIEGSAE